MEETWIFVNKTALFKNSCKFLGRQNSQIWMAFFFKWNSNDLLSFWVEDTRISYHFTIDPEIHLHFWTRSYFFSRAVLLFKWKYFGSWSLVQTMCGRHADDLQMTCGWHESEILGEISLADDICHPDVIRRPDTRCSTV